MKKVILIILILAIAGGAAAFFFIGSTQAKEPTYFPFVPGDDFITNINGSTSYIKISLTLAIAEINEEEQTAFLKKNQAVIRDTIIFTLREKPFAFLNSPDAHDKLKEELVAKLNEILGIDYIYTIYFSDYVLQ